MVEARKARAGEMGDGPVRVLGICVRAGRMECTVEVCDDLRSTNAQIAAYMEQALPSLGRHACVNGKADTFAGVIDDTPIPHLIEHAAIDIQTRAAKRADAVFVGTSEWTDEQRGLARIQISFADDLEALHALTEAVRLVNGAVLSCRA